MTTMHTRAEQRRAAVWAAALAIAVCGSAARADTHYVDPSSPDPKAPYATSKTAAHEIADAVKAAEKGDTVQVAAGTYKITKTIAVGKAITVQGAGADKSTIDAGGKCGAVSLGGGAVFTGFTITGGKARSGGGVNVGAGATLTRCTISNNVAERYGGGISARGGKNQPALIADCKIVGNRVTRFMHTDTPWGGGGVYANEGTVVRSCLIKDNEAPQRGGGIWCHGGSRAENCTIVGNRAPGKRVRNPNGPGSMEEGGGGAYCDFAGLLLNCLLYGNSAKIGGGAVLSTNGRAKNCTIVGNTAGRSGGGVQTLGVAWIVNTIIHGNTRGAKDKKKADDLYVSHYYHVDVHQLTLGKATATRSCIGEAKLHVTRQRFYLGPTAGYDPKRYKNTFNKSGCVDEDPGFVDPPGHDYRLKADSPCVNAGRKEAWMDDAKDLDGKPRLRGSAADIGAYEQ